MNQWKKPDERWSIFGIRSHEEYINQYLVKGRFHSAVPKDVVHAYETVEHIMAQAYHHWPIYDEAFKKLIGTVEMAIKIRCNQLNVKSHKLVNLIHKLKNFYPNDFISRLNAIRRLRNSFAHPTQSYLYGRHSIFLYYSRH